VTLSQSLKLLKEKGFVVPDNAITFARDKEFEQRGLACVWTCNCGYIYESPVPVLEFDHNCGKISKQTWPRP
jgi:hypothetical protein